MKWLGTVLTVGTFAVLYLLERRRPLRDLAEAGEARNVRNLAVASGAALAIRLLEKPVADRLTRFVEQNGFGLLKILRLPRAAETFLAVVLLDYTLYIWHVLTHKVPFLWRFHRIHHADLDLTTTTALRFHFGEMTISVAFRAGQILLIGVSPRALEIWQNALLVSVLFHHSNVRLGESFEKRLRTLVVTPRMHGIHHSIIRSERDSNWSSGLTVWDFLHGTFRDDVPQPEITIGVEEFDSSDEVTLGKMLLEPFISSGRNERVETEQNRRMITG